MADAEPNASRTEAGQTAAKACKTKANMEHLQSEQLKALKGADDEMVMEILGRNSGLSVEAPPLIEGYDGPSDG